MSDNFSPTKTYTIEIESLKKLVVISNISKGIKLRNLEENYILDLEIDEFLKIEINTELEIKEKFIINLLKNHNITSLNIAGKFDDLEISGNISELYFGSCGIDYNNVIINTQNLPKLLIDEAVIHNLILNNLSENTTAFFGVSSRILNLTTNQRKFFIYAYDNYNNETINTTSETKIYFTPIDPLKYKVNF
jgi:hypothetical protein